MSWLIVCALLSLALSCQHDVRRSETDAMRSGKMQSTHEPDSVGRSHSPGAQSDERKMSEYSGEGFKLMVPRGVRIERRMPADFVTYNFTRQNEAILHAYVGNQPNLMSDGRATGPESILQINGMPCKRVQAQGRNGILYTEVLIRFPRDRGWPTYIHFRYDDIKPESRAIAESIIRSVKAQSAGTQPAHFPDEGASDFPPPRRSMEDVIEDMTQRIEELKKQKGMTEEVKELEAKLEMMKDIHRQAEEKNRESVQKKQ